MLRMPCNTTLSAPQPTPLARCSKRDYFTPEEVAAARSRLLLMAAAFLEGRSPCCDAPMRDDGTRYICTKCQKFAGRVNRR